MREKPLLQRVSDGEVFRKHLTRHLTRHLTILGDGCWVMGDDGYQVMGVRCWVMGDGCSCSGKRPFGPSGVMMAIRWCVMGVEGPRSAEFDIRLL